jgi:cellulose biosynthesis protein BcsQ
MSLANIAWLLANHGHKVLTIDWDLEAPGLPQYFRPFLDVRTLTSSRGLIDLFSDYVAELYGRFAGGELLQNLRAQFRSAYDYVLIDSRTGLSDTAGICYDYVAGYPGNVLHFQSPKHRRIRGRG